jgi:hypothetical protein
MHLELQKLILYLSNNYLSLHLFLVFLLTLPTLPEEEEEKEEERVQGVKLL